MSFSTVRDAIVTRLNTVGVLGAVFEYEPYSRDNPESEAFKAAFVVGGVLNMAWVDHLDRRELKVPEDDDRRKIHRDWRINIVHAFGEGGASADDFEAILDAVAEAFNATAADRKLGGVCVTHTRLRASGIRLSKYADRLTVHYAPLDLTTEEVV